MSYQLKDIVAILGPQKLEKSICWIRPFPGRIATDVRDKLFGSNSNFKGRPFFRPENRKDDKREATNCRNGLVYPFFGRLSTVRGRLRKLHFPCLWSPFEPHLRASLKPLKKPVNSPFSLIIFRFVTSKVTRREALKVIAKRIVTLWLRISCCGALLSLVHIPGNLVNFAEKSAQRGAQMDSRGMGKKTFRFKGSFRRVHFLRLPTVTQMSHRIVMSYQL